MAWAARLFPQTLEVILILIYNPLQATGYEFEMMTCQEPLLYALHPFSEPGVHPGSLASGLMLSWHPEFPLHFANSAQEAGA